ncbi:MAG: hypothetical protein LBJ90_03650, partial [Treponema sp.]|nr:hypothetical protein [Treponema sp.]
GKEYRINGKNNKLYLEQKTGDAWQIVASYEEGLNKDTRENSGLGRNAWVKAGSDGDPVTEEIIKKSFFFGGDKYIYKLFPWRPD